ncbi:hypothetical protein F5Y04DRAFT_85961 [Hypomontagnella monticulosa]|nr:hypothetical protein F5Y04DRAFT_85961 [Hypomontagnella monticulosa]
MERNVDIVDARTRIRYLPGTPLNEELERLRAGGLYDIASEDIRWFRDFVQSIGSRLHPETLPPKPKMEQPDEDEFIMVRTAIKYLRALVAQMQQLVDLYPRLLAPLRIDRNLGSYEKVLKFARCAVRLQELDADWVISTIHYEGIVGFGKMALQQGPGPDADDFSEEDLQTLRGEIELWDEEYPAVKAAYSLVTQSAA